MTTPPAPRDPGGRTVAGRAGSVPVEHAMVSVPKTLPPSTSVAQAVAAFTDHVHMLLLVGPDGRLLTTLCRDDLVDLPGDRAEASAVDHGRLEGRTVAAGTSLEEARSRLETLGVRRVAVVDADQRLLGLLCLKRHRGGYCSDAGVTARAAAR